MSSTLNLAALRATPVRAQPFPWLMLPNFIKPEYLPGIETDFPPITTHGSLPLQSLRYGENFNQLVTELRGPDMQAIIAEKFATDLTDRPTTLTVRGQCRAIDGRIHTDSVSKLITVLVYLNGQWEQPGGRLRLLRTPTNLDDYVAEVAPDQGTLIAFKNQPNAWHGHHPFVGPRRAIQLNWVKSQRFVWKENLRHRLSAFLKKSY